MMGAMELGPLLNAHGYLRVERPPVLWEAAADDVALVRTLGEMIAAGLQRGNELGDIVLRANNVTVFADPDEELTVPAPGDYVALSILGAGDWRPEIHWRPGQPGAPVLVSGGLDRAARAAGIPYAYTRSDGDSGSVTVFVLRQNPACARD